jgi:hypothetical protein
MSEIASARWIKFIYLRKKPVKYFASKSIKYGCEEAEAESRVND